MTVRTLIQKLAIWSLAIVALQMASVRADVILDNFSSPSTTASATLTANPSSSTFSIGVAVLGGTRDTTVAITGANAPGSVGAEGYVGGGFAELDSHANTIASLTLAYTGLSLNVSGFEDLKFIFSSLSLGGANDMPVTVTINGGTPVTEHITTTGGQSLTFNLSSFGSPSTITSLNVSFNDGNAGNSFVLTGMGADPAPAAVPEPASFLLWGAVGMVGVWYGRRKMQRKLAA